MASGIASLSLLLFASFAPLGFMTQTKENQIAIGVAFSRVGEAEAQSQRTNKGERKSSED